MTHRTEILGTAGKLITGDREAAYGTPAENFARIAAFWSAYKGVEFSATDVAMMMSLVKTARIANGEKTGNPSLDSFVDLCGYGAIAGQLATSWDPVAVENCR